MLKNAKVIFIQDIRAFNFVIDVYLHFNGNGGYGRKA